MLDLFRKQKAASKWILGFITGIMALGMVVFFIPSPTSVSDGGAGGAVAKVGSTEISAGDYVTTFRRFLKNSKYPKDISFLKQVGVPRQILDDMISQKLLIQEAAGFGFTASDRELRDRILGYPLFAQMGGQLNMQFYQSVLEKSGTTIEEFEANERNQILIGKLQHLVTDSIIVTPEDAQRAYRNDNEKVTLSYVLVDPTEIEKTTKVDEVELKRYFDTHAQSFITTEQRKVKYVLVDMNKLRATTRLTDEDLHQYFEANRTRYFVSDRTRVSHILFRTPGKSPEEIEKVRQRALDVLAKARAGADFAQLAKEYSEDPGSKIANGDLGWVDQTTAFIPEFKQVALSLGTGAVSDLVLTQFGFHIIKATDHQGAHTLSFEEAKDQIKPTLMAQKIDRDGLAQANQIYAALAAKPAEIDSIAKRFGAEVRETPLFAVGDSLADIGSNPDFEKKVFSTLLNKVSDPVRVGPGFAIPLVLEIKPPHVPELADIREKAEKVFRKEKSLEMAKQKAEAFAKTAAAAKDFGGAAKTAGLKQATTEPFKRNATVKDLGNTRDISSVAFSLKVGETSGAMKVGNKLIVFRTIAREEVKPEDYEKNKAAHTAELLRQKRDAAFQTFQENLLTRAIRDGKVKVNEKALDAAISRRLT
jgi:peptidyl-prolyl cis-trans isomerase D